MSVAGPPQDANPPPQGAAQRREPQAWGDNTGRPILDESHIHPAIRAKIATRNADIVREVQQAVSQNDVVVVGMRQNPHPKRARKALDAAGIAYRYIEYGSYLSGWRRRNALKMWTGWPTFPMVFVKGALVGGASDVERLIVSGELIRLLTSQSAAGCKWRALSTD